MRIIAFHQEAFEQFGDWARTDKKLFERLNRSISETAKNLFDGIGKPEPLKADLKDYRSQPHQRRASPRL
jgi:toxin YoeB